MPDTTIPSSETLARLYRMKESLQLSEEALAEPLSTLLHNQQEPDAIETDPELEKRMQQIRSWKEALLFLRREIQQAVENPNASKTHRFFVNRLLASDWLGRFPKDKEVWQASSKLLLACLAHRETLPELLHAFTSRMFIRESPELERVWWHPLVEIQPLPPRLKGAALLHYLLDQPSLETVERSFWQARDLFQKEDPACWQQAHSWLIEQSACFPEISQRLALLVRITSEKISILDIEELLTKQVRLPFLYWMKILEHPELERHPSLLHRVLLQWVQIGYPLRNHDLRRLWHTAQLESDLDLTWRTLCLLRSRTPLPLYTEQVWKLLGEDGASPYHLSPLDKKNMDVIFSSLSSSAADWIRAYLTLVPVFHTQKRKSRSEGFSFSRLQSAHAKRTAELQEQNPWLRLKQPALLARWLHKPSLALISPPWLSIQNLHEVAVLILSFSDLLGCNHWHWQFSLLSQRISTWETQKNTWKSLTLQQRQACSLLIDTGKSIKESRLQEQFACFILRCIVVLLQNHSQILQDLQSMAAPLWLIRDTEAWILSPAYSHIRSTSLRRHTMPVPSLCRV